jgi:hypothetical protein
VAILRADAATRANVVKPNRQPTQARGRDNWRNRVLHFV